MRRSWLWLYAWRASTPPDAPLLGLGPFVPGGGASQVGSVEEHGEEHQVAEVHEGAPRHVVHVGRAAHLVHPAVHQAQHRQAHHHLQDLGDRDDHGAGAGHPQAGGPRRVVRVHERVHHVVHGHEPAAARHLVLVGVPGVQQHGDVVVPVQEDEGLLPEDDEHRVAWGKDIGGVTKTNNNNNNKLLLSAVNPFGTSASETSQNDHFKLPTGSTLQVQDTS